MKNSEARTHRALRPSDYSAATVEDRPDQDPEHELRIEEHTRRVEMEEPEREVQSKW